MCRIDSFTPLERSTIRETLCTQLYGTEVLFKYCDVDGATLVKHHPLPGDVTGETAVATQQ
jgi:hypothetical protein